LDAESTIIELIGKTLNEASTASPNLQVRAASLLASATTPSR
jgi:hypothetical protein